MRTQDRSLTSLEPCQPLLATRTVARSNSFNASAVRKDNAAHNLSLLNKIVLNLIRLDAAEKTKTWLRLKRKRAAWDDDVPFRILGLKLL